MNFFTYGQPADCRKEQTGSAPSDETAQGVVLKIKNTFIEIDDTKPAESGWGRQMSEPVKIYTAGWNRQMSNATTWSGPHQDTLSEFEEEDEPLELTPEPMANNLGNLSRPFGSSAKSSKVALLLSTAIPSDSAESKQTDSKPITDGGESTAPCQSPSSGATTMMVRNLPNKYSQAMLLDELQDSGFAQKRDFDFFYLPMDHANGANLGYCFINFTDPSKANSFASAFQCRKLRRFNSKKMIDVMPASIQGFQANYDHYASTNVAHAKDRQYRPLFLRSDIALPQPQKPKSVTKAPQASKPKKNKPYNDGSQQAGSDTPWQTSMSLYMEQPTQYDCWGKAASKTWAMPQNSSHSCPVCGTPVEATYRFCTSCGSDVSSLWSS